MLIDVLGGSAQVQIAWFGLMVELERPANESSPFCERTIDPRAQVLYIVQQ